MKRQHTLKREYTTKEDWLEDFLTNSNSKASLKSAETALRTFDIFCKVKVGLTPMISSLSIMENANSESEVLGLGLSVIMLNIGMYLGVPAVVIVGIRENLT